MIYKRLTILAVVLISFAFTTTKFKTDPKVTTAPVSVPAPSEDLSVEEEIINLYNVFSEKNTTMPNLASFKNAMLGYSKLEKQGQIEKNILTIIDFTLSSTKNRLWVLDMDERKVLLNTVVSHGKNTGNEFATDFSNTVNSLQSSLGFYVTGETYYGKNGLSLFIDGKEEEFNSRARERYVVIHGADYANPEVAQRTGRLGRSYGCPAVPTALTKEFIEMIKDKSVVYIHSNDPTYAKNSEMIKA